MTATTIFVLGWACGWLVGRLTAALLTVDHGHDCRCIGEWD